MSIKITKGQVISLTKDNGGLTKMTLGMGWTGRNGKTVDLDSYVALMTEKRENIDFIYWGNLRGHGVKHNGDDLTGGGRANDPNEEINIDFSSLPDTCSEIDMGLFIYSGADNLGEVVDAFVNVTDQSNTELLRYSMDDFSKSSSLMIATLIKRNGQWNFKGVGDAGNESLTKLKKKYIGNAKKSFLGGIFG